MQKPICILMEIHQASWKELVLQLVGLRVTSYHYVCVILVHVDPFLLPFRFIMFSCLDFWIIICIDEHFSIAHAATFVLLPLNYLVNNTGDGSKYPLAECSLHVLLILINYQNSILSDESMTDKSDDSATSESVSKVHVFSSGNTFSPWGFVLHLYD